MLTLCDKMRLLEKQLSDSSRGEEEELLFERELHLIDIS